MAEESCACFLIGFNDDEVNTLRQSLGEVFGIPEYCRDWIVGDIISRARELDGSCDWHLRKFVLLNGAEGDDVKRVMGIVRAITQDRVIFAVITDTSRGWRLEHLLGELLEEDEYFRQLRRARERRDMAKGPFLDIGKG